MEIKSELKVSLLVIFLIWVSAIVSALMLKFTGIPVDFNSANTLLLGMAGIYTGGRTIKKVMDGQNGVEIPTIDKKDGDLQCGGKPTGKIVD
jgi:hypothetical protein